jgi:hypothetical protein
MTGHQRQDRLGQLAIDDMQISPADGAGADPDQHLSGPRHRHIKCREPQRLAGRVEQQCTHIGNPPCRPIATVPSAMKGLLRRGSDQGLRKLPGASQ